MKENLLSSIVYENGYGFLIMPFRKETSCKKYGINAACIRPFKTVTTGFAVKAIRKQAVHANRPFSKTPIYITKLSWKVSLSHHYAVYAKGFSVGYIMPFG